MDLVILHTALEATKGETKFVKNHLYRHIDFENGNHVICGEPFTDVEFKSLFEDAMDKVKRDWIEIGLLKQNGSKISKNAFKELADVHEYGSGRKTYKVLYFRKTKDIIYGFYPVLANKSDSINQAYEWYLQTLNNNYEYLDDRDICFGNMGVPLSYTKLRNQ
jgi:hypothetical protein